MIDDTATKGDLQMMESFATQLHMKSPSKQATPSKDDGCVKNLLSKMVDDESIPGITSLSERSTSSTDVSSSYYQGEGSERWDLDDDDDELSYDALLVSSLNQQQQLTALNVVVEQPASTPVAENDGNNEQLQTIFEGTESVVEPAVVVESSSTVDIVDLVLPKVSWGTVEMRIYPIVLGDHPETWQGPPITIDWKHVAVLKQDLNDYEEKRIPRRTGLNLRMGGLDRRRILLRLGVEEADILAAAQNAHKVRVQRQQSVGPWRLSILKLEKKDPKPSFFRKVANKLLSLQRSAKSSVAKN